MWQLCISSDEFSWLTVNVSAGEADGTEITENEALALALALGQELQVEGR